MTSEEEYMAEADAILRPVWEKRLRGSAAQLAVLRAVAAALRQRDEANLALLHQVAERDEEG